MAVPDLVVKILAKLGSYTGAVKVVACGVQLDGTVTPLKVDADGHLLVHAPP